jgi:AraC-like DNA-binding protein
VRPTADHSLFADAPTGSFLVGRGWSHFCARKDLWGVVLWDRPGADDICALVTSLKLELRSGVAPHQSLVDASRVSGVDTDAFDVLSSYVRDHHSALANKVTRLALVRPGGLVGAVAAGFYETLDAPPYPVALFEDVDDATAWLQPNDRADLDAALAAIGAHIADAPPVVGSLRAVLAENLKDADVPSIARRLGMSPRTLQRRLSEAQTSFQQELALARVREAQRRMRDSDAPLTRIALEVGFATSQHFSTLFRRLVGQSPSEWRARHGAAR